VAGSLIFDQWATLQARIDELTPLLASATLDQRQRHQLQKEYSYLTDVLSTYRNCQHITQQLERARNEREHNQDSELAALYEEEIAQLEQTKKTTEHELEQLLFPPDPHDKHDVFIEIRAGTGGQEAALFAADLAQMYTNYATSRGWVASVTDVHETDLKGVKEITLFIQGKGAYGALKFESGTHRVQRVPATEASGRIHTSTATVAVFPEIEQDEELTIAPQDLRIDVFRAGGAGGQHVNKTESAVRITHIPTGVVVTCQDERSQHKNKAKAMKALQARLAAAKREEELSQRSKDRKEMVGSGMRAEKVRTYNFPQNRVTDHQVDVTLQKLDMVMAGDLGDIIQALQEKERQERRARPLVTPK
jgi:peptide chain release factor 1